MIHDTLANAAWYQNLPHGIPEALEYLRTTDLAALPEGRNELDGDRMFVLVQRYRPKALADAAWEAHRRYIDVQYILAGEERMGHLPLREGLAVRQPYDAAKDMMLFDVMGDLFQLSAGQFVIFLPQDIHTPGLASETSTHEVRKVLLKCRIDGA